MKTAESDNQKQQGATSEPAHVSSPSASTSTLVAPPTTASVEGLQLLVQARLSVSSPNDPFEHEAESMADEFVKSIHGRTVSAPSSSAGSIARSVPDSGLVEGGGGGLATTDDTASAIMSARSGGQSLSGDVRARFEGFFGADLGGVKIHNDGTSDNLCRSINAEAFTTGNDVFFTSRNFKPGSSSGDHLLAHELTHVVQQGNAPALSRSAMPEIQRIWNPFADKTRQKAADAGGMVATGKLGTAINGGLKGHSTDAQGNYVAPDAQTDSVKASATAGGALTIVADTAALFNAVVRLYYEWDSETTASVRDNSIGAVKSALSICQASTTIAASASASLVAFGTLPALGIAYSTINLALQSIRIHETRQAADATYEDIIKIEGKYPDESTRPYGDRKILAALTNLVAGAETQYIRSVFSVVADIINIGGQITLIATSASGMGAAVGGALVGMAAATQMAILLQSKVSQWMSAGAINTSRENVADAESALRHHESKLSSEPSEEDKEKSEKLKANVENSTIKNIELDAYASAAELIKYSAAFINKDRTFTPKALDLVGKYNISEAWMLNYVSTGATPEMLDKGAKLICEFIGKNPNAIGLVADLKDVAASLWKGIKFVTNGAWNLVCFGGEVISQTMTAGYERVLIPLWRMAMATPGLIFDFIDAAQKFTDFSPAGYARSMMESDRVDQEKARAGTACFMNLNHIVTLTSDEVTPKIKAYFDEKAKRGTDVKPGTVTELLKAPYKKFVAISRGNPPKGTKPFTDQENQMRHVDENVRVLICQHAPDRVDKTSVSINSGEVDFKYTDGGKTAKTKGWFASWRGREAV